MKRSKMATFLLTDTSHVLKSGGDVQTEYVEILLRLASGILVWPGNYMMHHPKKVRAAFPEFNVMCQQYPQSEPMAFWMRAKA